MTQLQYANLAKNLYATRLCMLLVGPLVFQASTLSWIPGAWGPANLFSKPMCGRKAQSQRTSPWQAPSWMTRYLYGFCIYCGFAVLRYGECSWAPLVINYVDSSLNQVLFRFLFCNGAVLYWGSNKGP